MLDPSMLAVKIYRIRDHGVLPMRNVFMVCRGPRDLVMWTAPHQRWGDFVRRILCEDTLCRTPMATGTLDSHRLDFVDLLSIHSSAVPELVRRIFTSPYATDHDHHVNEYMTAELWIESKPTNLTVATIVGEKPTFH